MRYVTESDIKEMRARGYDAQTIHDAESDAKLTKAADELILRVNHSFKGVVLGSGVGLSEGQGRDDYADEETCARLRANDEKEDWTVISSDDLNSCHSSLSFFDGEGMRFHLPAFMVCELRGQFNFGMSFCLTYLKQHCREQFELLDKEQRSVVREFLEFLRRDPDYEFHISDIDRALRIFWT